MVLERMNAARLVQLPLQFRRPARRRDFSDDQTSPRHDRIGQSRLWLEPLSQTLVSFEYGEFVGVAETNILAAVLASEVGDHLEPRAFPDNRVLAARTLEFEINIVKFDRYGHQLPHALEDARQTLG
ncbi:hypothetical protein [Mesorhizobium sp.]|uniref:hypothetical protein n=1 Tax=Mesorhizobium sp. TaxID=1871066 RepID=UPI0025BBF1FD|nr:hypothetical protein [Mesorhizobium sp.]